MLISTSEELRLYSPANAIDHIETIQGFLDSSEHDCLSEKLGDPLHDALVAYYRSLRTSDDGISTFIQYIANGDDLSPYARLLTLCQRIVTFDALGRAVNMQAVSVNGSGVNISTADDYGKADREAVGDYKATCIKETHAAINALLVTLEKWYQEVAAYETAPEADSAEAEKKEIAEAWTKSRYFYLASGLVIPSATVLQEYLNIYDSRERFITMLPDLRTIQEDVIAPAIGDDFLDYIVSQARKLAAATTASTEGVDDSDRRLLLRIIHKLRKTAARHLESRTMAIKIDDPRREAAHNEAVRNMQDLCDYLTAHQGDLPEEALESFKTSPLYVSDDDPDTTPYEPQFQNNAVGNALFITPALS